MNVSPAVKQPGGGGADQLHSGAASGPRAGPVPDPAPRGAGPDALQPVSAVGRPGAAATPPVRSPSSGRSLHVRSELTSAVSPVFQTAASRQGRSRRGGFPKLPPA